MPKATTKKSAPYQSVAIYTTPTCPYCKMTKEFFKEQGVKYTEIDVAVSSEKAKEMIEKSGQMGVPVIAIEDKQGKEHIVIGYDRPQLAKLLGIKE